MRRFPLFVLQFLAANQRAVQRGNERLRADGYNELVKFIRRLEARRSSSPRPA